MSNKPVLQLIGKPVTKEFGFGDVTFYKFAYVDQWGVPDWNTELVYVVICTGSYFNFCMDNKATTEEISEMSTLIDSYNAFGDYATPKLCN